jgi:hypothetical protein
MQNQALRWRKTDDTTSLAHCPEHESLELYYGRIYTTGMGYNYSTTNNLINNLKKSPNSPPNILRYKQKAITQFAEELIELLHKCDFPVALVPIPPSKTQAHPEYDDRIEQVGKLVAANLQCVRCLPLLYRTADVDSHHTTRFSRSPDDIYKDLSINEFLASDYREEGLLIVLDDVLTSGAHFAAAKRRLEWRFSTVEIAGIFWAKAQSPEEFY